MKTNTEIKLYVLGNQKESNKQVKVMIMTKTNI